ncbi:hypothetical protein LAB19_001650 [Salmonella enterica subsp. enterica serovar Manhattan]|nr:hypothetical protein [Salmonella enterica subsp. enterica serovar Livingstone]EIC3047316.1 hypothetical protein [Salmonella enterica subsp. enterica serovar Manhattan]
MTFNKNPSVIRAGEKLQLTNSEGATIQIGNSKGIIFQVDDAPANYTVATLDFPQGKYTVVEIVEDELVSSFDITVTPVFTKQSKKDFLRETIELIDQVITARLSGDEAAISQMTIKGNTFAYESLAVLQQLKAGYERQLVKLIQQERRKQGHSPIQNIKIRFTR